MQKKSFFDAVIFSFFLPLFYVHFGANDPYSLERRRERFLIQNAWQQIEGKKENILDLETDKVGRRRCIRSTTIPTALSEKFRTKIQHSTARQMEGLFNAIPYTLQCLTDVSLDTFKGHLDKWLRTIPDTPKIGNYGASVPAESNSLSDQAKQVGQAGDPNRG